MKSHSNCGTNAFQSKLKAKIPAVLFDVRWQFDSHDFNPGEELLVILVNVRHLCFVGDRFNMISVVEIC